jgi:trimethylamine---corrinoid protein Co-methyltransferase
MQGYRDHRKPVGVRFESEVVRELFKKRGARVEGDKVFIPRRLMEEALETTPKQDYSVPAQKRVVAATPFSNAPFILDDDTGAIRRCNIGDAIKMYQINETSPFTSAPIPAVLTLLTTMARINLFPK